MKKTLLYTAAASMLFAASCKETLQPIVVGSSSQDTFLTYTEPVEPAEARRIYIEELTGVTCVNCPAGAEELHTLSTVNYPNQLSIIAFHAGTSFTAPIGDITKQETSKQDFRTTDGDQIWQNVWGPGDAKPCTVIDRIKGLTTVNNDANRMYNNGKGTWEPAIEKDKTLYPATPVNMYITSTFNSEKSRYDIVVKVKYTEAVTKASALHVFLSQDSIVDAQLLPGEHNVKNDYVFNHVFRKALTNAVTGKIILPDMATKNAGLVYEYRTSVTIDPNDAVQKYWNADQMHVTAFVAVADNSADIHVMQVKDTKLKGE
ncbi:Omp28-related outer membrane protein [Taibaiella lutea]|uniref:Omp28-related outer membrane protein n=1 Tax=Taibaiella lutea TaxID=2608001 RepID=A0A5M6CEM9_9BACT|nr:Omp28-related outer membrane protein [Taibaiella lutea]KAA5532352.1 Omp28-related outer membrane protein [Taibaiella lutea]